MTTLTRCFVFVSVAICLIMAEQWRLTVAIKNYCIIFTFPKESPFFQRRFFICLLPFAHNLWRRVFMQISTIASTIKRKIFTKSASRRKNSQALIITIKISFIISPLPRAVLRIIKRKTFIFRGYLMEISGMLFVWIESRTSASWRKQLKKNFEIDAIPLWFVNICNSIYFPPKTEFLWEKSRQHPDLMIRASSSMAFVCLHKAKTIWGGKWSERLYLRWFVESE